MKRIFRYALMAFAGLLGLFPLLLILLSGGQIGKNRLVFADMMERVKAVRDFQLQHGRLPKQEELEQVSRALPARHTAYLYRIVTSTDNGYTADELRWPDSGGWAIWFWRGEWAEIYTSWDDHCTIETSWWKFNAPGFVILMVAVALAVISRRPFLKS